MSDKNARIRLNAETTAKSQLFQTQLQAPQENPARQSHPQNLLLSRDPYALLLNCPHLTKEQKHHPWECFQTLDPFALKDELESKLRTLFHELRSGNHDRESTRP